MNPWVIVAIVFGSIFAWFWCSIRVREMMRRRHCMRDVDGTNICQADWGDADDSHGWGVVAGFFLGPLTLILVCIYELADGTTRRRIRAARQSS